MKCQIKVIKEVAVFPEYRPCVGAIYDAVYSPATHRKKGTNGKAEFCVIDILDKKIILREGEFKLV